MWGNKRDVSAIDPNVVYVLVDNHNALKDEKPKGLDACGIQEMDKVIISAEVYKSGDQGESWQKGHFVFLLLFSLISFIKSLRSTATVWRASS